MQCSKFRSEHTENVELMPDCRPQHLSLGAARMKQGKKQKERASDDERIIGLLWIKVVPTAVLIS